MELIRILISRCAAHFRRRRLDEDLDAELSSHVELADRREYETRHVGKRGAVRQPYGGSAVLRKPKKRTERSRGFRFLKQSSTMRVMGCGNCVSLQGLRSPRF